MSILLDPRGQDIRSLAIWIPLGPAGGVPVVPRLRNTYFWQTLCYNFGAGMGFFFVRQAALPQKRR